MVEMMAKLEVNVIQPFQGIVPDLAVLITTRVTFYELLMMTQTDSAITR